MATAEVTIDVTALAHTTFARLAATLAASGLRVEHVSFTWTDTGTSENPGVVTLTAVQVVSTHALTPADIAGLATPPAPAAPPSGTH